MQSGMLEAEKLCKAQHLELELEQQRVLRVARVLGLVTGQMGVQAAVPAQGQVRAQAGPSPGTCMGTA